jgi:flagellar protein FlgJ
MKIAPGENTPMTPENAAQDKKLHDISKQFEALFVNQMVSEMRKTVVRGGLIPESQAEKVYQSMLDSDYAQKIADSEQVGLSKMIYQQLLRTTSMK